GNNPLDPYLVKLDEVKRGVINHPLRFSITRGYNSNYQSIMWPANYGTGWCEAGVIAYNITNGGSNYSSSTTITLVGGHSVNGSPDTNEATATVTVTNGVITAVTPVSYGGDYFTNPVSVTVQLNNVGSGTGAVISPVVDYPCLPYGARLVLDPTYLSQHSGAGCSAGSKCLTGAGLTVAQALATYGMVDLDNTCCAIFSTYGDVDLEEDPNTFGQIASSSSGIGTLSMANFHIVDTSPLAKNASTDHTNCSGGLPCQNGQVLPFNNAGLIPPGAAWITATNASGTSNVVSFILIPPTIGTTYTEIAVLAGDYSGSKGTSGGYQIPFWVNGITNKAVTWSLQAGAQGTITSGGVYTPPATLGTTGLQDVATATLTADPNVTASVYIDLLPNSGNYQANTIRVNTGRTGSNFGPDGNGNYWLKEVGSEIGAATRKSDGSWNFYKGTGESGVYPTYAYTSSDIRHRFIVPNGNYKVRVLGGWGNGSPSSAMSDKNWNHMPVTIMATNAGVPTIEGLHWNMMQMAAWPYAANSNSDYTFGSIVSNNVLDVAMGPDIPQPGWTTCGSTHSGSCYHQPEVSGVVVAPDASSAHWQIDVVSIPSQNGGTYIDSSQNQTVSPGKSVYLYLQDWYTGLNDATWMLLSGAGTLTPTTLQLTPNITMNVAQYTAPSTQPNDNQGVVIQAQSQSNPSVKATFTLRLKNTSAAPVNYFK
ncbi:MAG TPA: hypothetical protein VN081_01055, partial [Dongiaceae bacterium]|nr:hypothetical protein [Dongiaceae bacterium]